MVLRDADAQRLCATLAANASCLTALDLSGNSLTVVPPAVCEIAHLVTLRLRDNGMRQLPLEITDLR